MFSALFLFSSLSSQASMPLPEVKGVVSLSPFQEGVQLYILGAAAQEVWRKLSAPIVRDSFSNADVKLANGIRCVQPLSASSPYCWIRLDSAGIIN